MHRLLAALPRWIFVLLALGVALAHTSAPVFAQVPAQLVVSDTVYEVQLADGSTIIGRVVSVSGDNVTLETQAGVRVQVTRSQIRSIRPVQGRIQDGEVWRDDPHGTRLFFAPTGRSLARGEGYFGVYELFFPFVTYGITDSFIITAGTPIVPGAIGEFAYFGPKLRIINAPRAQLSAGVFAGLWEGGTAGVAYGVGTWGGRDNALTAGAGWLFAADSDNAEFNNRPLLMLGGELRTGARTKLLTENYLFTYKDECADFDPTRGTCRSGTEAVGLLSVGLRFFGERLSADAGVGLGVGTDDVTCCIPLVNFVYSFGRRR